MRHLLPCILTLLTLMGNSLFPVWAQGNDPDVLEFAFITDTHQFGSTTDVRSADANVKAFVDYCNATPSIQCALFGGDFYNAYDTNHEQGIGFLSQAAQGFAPLRIPFYATRGNHDCNGKCKTPDGRRDNSQIVTDQEYYQLFSPVSADSRFYHPEGIVTDPVNPYGNYYYRDFEQQRVRIIVLNNFDRDSLETPGYHGQQMKWLAETALDFRSKGDISAWSFLILGHALTIDHLNNPITRLLHAYVRGQDFFDSDAGVSYGRRYSYRPIAHFIGFIYGHYHEDIYDNWDGYNMISGTRGYATGSEVETDNTCFDHFILNTRTRTLEERRIGRGQTRIYSYDTPRQLWPGLSFPEADGMGHYTVGGRFGRIEHVTNLNDDGPGSLRMALRDNGARTIVFDVEGTIHLRSPLVIRHDSLTIAGQSAPGAGIKLRDRPLVINASEVLIRYIDVSQLMDDEFGYHNLMIDHVTAHCDTATAISIRRTQDVSVQSCRISTGSATQPALLAGGFKASYHLNHIFSSARAIGFSDNEGENRWIQVARNLVTGWKDHAMYGGCHQGEFTIHENYFIPDSSTLNFKILDVAEDGSARYWAKLNVLKGYEQHTRAVTPLINDRPGLAYHPLAADTLLRPLMDPVARPHDIKPEPTCLAVSAFNFVYMFGNPTANDIYNKVMREAGTGYRPEQLCQDSLQGPDLLGYLERVVRPERSIVILYDNDVHCQIDGYPYLVGQREPAAADSAYVAIVSCGNFLQGGLAGTMTHGEAITDVMKHIGYDALALGSHDFDLELQHTKKMLDDIELPALCANLRHIGTDTLVFRPYIIRQYGRRRVAFVGVTTPSTQITNAFALSDEDGLLLYDFDPEHVYQRVQRAVDQARREGVDFVIVLSQLGYESDRFGINAKDMIHATTGIDAVLDGFTHNEIPQLMIPNRDGNEVLYSQGGQRFSNIGKLIIDPDGRMISQLIPAKDLRFRDPIVTQIVDSLKTLYMGSAEDYAGRALIRLDKPKEYILGDTLAINAGYLVTDAMQWAAEADAAWLNVGSIRNSLPAGELTRGDILEMVPYDNELVCLEVPGHVVEDYIRMLLKKLPSDGGGYIVPTSGFKMRIKKKHKGYELLQLFVFDRAKSNYLPVEANKIYRITTTDYCLNIGWRSSILYRRYKPQHLGINYNDVVFQYINEQLNGVVAPTPELMQQRITLE